LFPALRQFRLALRQLLPQFRLQPVVCRQGCCVAARASQPANQEPEQTANQQGKQKL